VVQAYTINTRLNHWFKEYASSNSTSLWVKIQKHSGCEPDFSVATRNNGMLLVHV
jgi:hypothetical protein